MPHYVQLYVKSTFDMQIKEDSWFESNMSLPISFSIVLI